MTDTINFFHTRMIRGQTFRMTLVARDENGRPRDLTDAKAYFALCADIKIAPSVMLTSDVALPDPQTNAWRLGVEIPTQIGSDIGKLIVTLIPDDTKILVALGDDDPWFYDVWIVETNGDKWPVITTSRLALYQEITVLP